MSQIELYQWSVMYEDGSSLCEYDERGHHSFHEVEVGRVVLLRVIPVLNTRSEFAVHCNPEEGIRPIMFRTVAIDAITGETARWHVFGTQQTVNGVNVKCLHYLDERTGMVTIADRPLEVG